MKKILIILLALILISGCSDTYAGIKNVKNIVTVGNTSITNKTLYPILVDSYGLEKVISFINNYIYETECSATDDLEAKIDQEIATLTAEEGDEFYLNYYHETVEAYRESLYDDFKIAAIVETYLQQNFTEVLSEYLPTKLQVADFADYDIAKTALAEIKAGGDFVKIAEKYGTGDFTGEVEVYTTLSGLPKEVTSYGLNATEINIVDSPITASDGGLYIVKVVDINRESYKEEIIESILEDATINAKAMTFFCKKLKIKFYDKTIIDLLATSNPEYLG